MSFLDVLSNFLHLQTLYNCWSNEHNLYVLLVSMNPSVNYWTARPVWKDLSSFWMFWVYSTDQTDWFPFPIPKLHFSDGFELNWLGIKWRWQRHRLSVGCLTDDRAIVQCSCSRRHVTIDDLVCSCMDISCRVALGRRIHTGGWCRLRGTRCSNWWRTLGCLRCWLGRRRSAMVIN